MNKKDKLYIPQGTESLHRDEAYTHRNFVHTMEENFQLWGYFPVQTPVFDYYEDYRNLMGQKRLDESYRLIDREGELLMLRSDITLFLARQMGIQLTEASLPLRVYYADTILRYQKKEDISHNEFFQVGCELLGLDNQDGDLEILLLMKEQLDLLGMKDYRIHLGSRSVFNKISQFCNVKDEQHLSNALDERNKDLLKALLSAGQKEELVSELVDFLLFIGTAEDFAKYSKKLSNGLKGLIAEELEQIESILLQLKSLGIENDFRVDFSEIGSQNYYSGLVFQCYAQGADSAVASGGRYDGLIFCRGKDVSSVGFSIYLRKLEALLPSLSLPEIHQVKDNGDFAERYKKARSLRTQKKTAIL